MPRFTNEFLVGLLALVVVALAAYGIVRTDDRPDGVKGTWVAYVVFPSAEGVYPDTPVRIAGVTVGSVDFVALDGKAARLTLQLQAAVQLPTDSTAEIRGEGMLGDKFIRLTPGVAAALIPDGGSLQSMPLGDDIDSLTKKLSLIADDVGAITAAVRTMTSDQTTQDQLKATLSNIEALSLQLREMAAANQGDLAIVADNLRQTSEMLKGFVSTSGGAVETELATVRNATESLDRAIHNIEAITIKLKAGEGTVGKLLSDETTIDSINETLASVNTTARDVQGLVGGLSKIRTDVYYRGSYYFGTDPDDARFAGNPVAGGARNVLGLTIAPQEDYWYILEVTSHPQGLITYEDHYFPELGTAYREYVTRPTYRLSFMFAKRWGPAVFRFGLKESSGGVGIDGMFFGDRFQLSADVYDFTYASWPVLDGTPNLQLTARAYPLRNIYVEGGVENLILDVRYRYFTGFIGGGFTFNDQDLRLLLPALPL